MVSLDILKKRGFTIDAIRAMAERAQPLQVQGNTASAVPLKGNAVGGPQPPEPVTRTEASDDPNLAKFQTWQSRMNMRIQRGREENMKPANWRIFHALDIAWETPFRQINPTLLASFLDSDPNKKEVTDKLASWGFDLSKVTDDVPDPKDPSKKIKRINIPAFFEIVVPILRAYVMIRLGKIMNDRRLVPFIPYDPAISTAISRLQCEAIAGRVEIMAKQYDYFGAVKQAAFQMLLYSYSMMLPVEEWHCEAQEVENEKNAHYSDPDKPKAGQEQRHYRIVKEGIRYHIPHPSKMFMNRAYKPSTVNTDTGMDYIGHSRAMVYGDIRGNKNFWNVDKVSMGDTAWWATGDASVYFNAIFGGCVMNFPVFSTPGAGGPTGNDRELNNALNVYNQSMDDKTVFVTEYFEKLVPKDIGIGDYDCPVWTRWVVAGNGTIVYGSPIAYAPGVFMAYDIDDNRERNASLALEILPFQDQFSNLMSQFLLSVKQNLTNVNFYDKDIIDEKDMSTVRNLGEKAYRFLNWVPFSSKKMRNAIQDITRVFFSARFQPVNTTEQIAAMRMLLEMLERILVMSSQEAGQAAQHELRAEEVRNIQNSSSTRLKFTAIPVDDAIDVMRRQNYQALMAYGEMGFYVAVAHDPRLTPEVLEALGFTAADPKTHALSKHDKKIVVKVDKKDAILIEAFASHRDSIDRVDNAKLAGILAQALASWLANPMIAQTIGKEQAISS
jgi:hypothetical protein